MRTLLTALLLLWSGCQKPSASTQQAAPPTAASSLEEWAASKMDLRTWNGCTRGTEVRPEGLHVVFQIDAEGQVSGPTFDPPGDQADPAMLCLGMVWVKPPEVPAPVEAGPVRLPVQKLLATTP